MTQPLYAVPSTLAHAAELAQDLRMEDAREIVSSSGKDPAFALASAVSRSELARTALDGDGRPVLIFGVARLGPGLGSPWLMASPKVAAHGRQIARLTRPLVDALQDDYPVLTNYADTRNELHLRWLRWAGFSLTRVTTAYATDGTPFVEFIRIRNHHVRTR